MPFKHAARITEKDLQALCDEINDEAGLPRQPYARNPETGIHAPVANVYHLAHAYGGVNLHQMSDKQGSTSTPIGGGYHTKRALYGRMQAFLHGIWLSKENEHV